MFLLWNGGRKREREREKERERERKADEIVLIVDGGWRQKIND